MLLLVTAFTTVALTYFQLASEDYRWWWRSFLSGASAGFFMYGYALFYYTKRSEMSGALQAVFFFGYMGMVREHTHKHTMNAEQGGTQRDWAAA